MNQNHSNLFNNLIPILWEPGHMGAFFGRFLFDNTIEQSSLTTQDKENYNKKAQVEWHWNDITSEYFQYNLTNWKLKLHDNWQSLKQYYPDDTDFDAVICYIVAQLNYPYFSDNTRLPIHLTVREPYKNSYPVKDLMDRASYDFNFNNITFPYIKSHIQGNVQRINQFPWKKKIVCTFPEHKAWMGDIFLFYKHYWYYILNPGADKNGFMEFNKQVIFPAVEYNRHFFDSYKKYNITDSSYITIDMYDLIFNENFEQLKLIDHQYDLGISNTQLQSIRDTRKGLIEILDIFGLSHTSNIVTPEDHASKFLTKEVLDIYNTVKKIGP